MLVVRFFESHKPQIANIVKHDASAQVAGRLCFSFNFVEMFLFAFSIVKRCMRVGICEGLQYLLTTIAYCMYETASG